jgi:hypothetical protein
MMGMQATGRGHLKPIDRSIGAVSSGDEGS